MKLYSIQASNNCRRVNATIAHLGLTVEVVEPNLKGGEHKQPAFLAINPNGKVPVLVDGDFTLWEGRAIMQYLASTVPGNTLWPADPKKQADISRWFFWETAHLSKATGTFGFEKMFKPMFMKQEPDMAAVASAEKDFHAVAPVLNGHLEGKKFLLGDDVTLADFTVGACFSFADAAGLPWGDYKHIQAWWTRLNDVPAWKNSAPKFG